MKRPRSLVNCRPETRPGPFGIAFREELHSGLPVVGTRMVRAAGIVTEDCGVFAETIEAPTLPGVLRRPFADALAGIQRGKVGPAWAAELCVPGRNPCRRSGPMSDLAVLVGVGSA
jgi:hypothetical protein